MTNVQEIGAAQGGGQRADQANFPIAASLYPAALFFTGLKADKNKFIKRPYDLVENVFRALFGSAEFDALKSVNSSSAAHFFARWARRTNFINRWAPSPLLEGQDLALQNDGMFPVLWALRSQEIVNSFVNLATRMSSNSIWEILMSVFQRAYYEFTMLPNMPLVTYDLATNTIAGMPEVDAGTAALEAAKLRSSKAAASLEDLKTNSPAATAAIAAAEAEVKNASDWQVEVSLNPSLAGSVTSGAGPKSALKPLRLLNFVTKPQLQYCAVPRCNVIFPSMVRGFSFSEDYSSQPTRVYIGNEQLAAALASGQNSQLAKTATTAAYPSIARNFMQLSKTNTRFASRNFLIFPEEFYKGPVVNDVLMPDWHMMLSNELARQQTTAGGTSTDKPDKAVYLARLEQLMDTYAAFEYTKERGAARAGNVSMRFNPYIVPGFPTVVIDREDTNVHVFGYVQNVTHQLSTDGMSTMVNLAFIQTFDEFFERLVNDSAGFGGVVLESDAYTQAAAAYKTAQATRATITDPTAAAAADKSVAAAKTALDLASQAAYMNQSTAYAAAVKAVVDLEEAKTTGAPMDAAKAKRDVLKTQLDAMSGILFPPDMAPAHPIPDIRRRFQVIENASDYYSILFYQNQNQSKYGGAAFDWREAIGAVNAFHPDAEPTKIDLGTVATSGTTRTVGTNAVREGYSAYGVRGSYKQFMEGDGSSEKAMRFVSRPIISLEEYIDFHGDRGLREMRESPYGAGYYVKIMNFEQGPGPDPGYTEYGYPKQLITADTRLDWETRLLNYRTKMRSTFVFKA
jgi:hypothetical protein